MAFNRRVRPEIIHITGFHQNLHGNIIYIVGRNFRTDLGNHLCKLEKLAGGGLFDAHSTHLPLHHSFPERDPCRVGRRRQTRDSRVTNPSRRNIDNSPESLIILFIEQQPQIRDHILNLSPLVKRVTSINLIRKRALPQSLLNRTRLGICPVKHGKITIRCLILINPGQNRRGKHKGLLLICIGIHDRYLLPLSRRRETLLLNLHRIPCNQTICRFYNSLSGTIILLQTKLLSLRIVLPEIQNILYPRSAERVYTLSIIPHHTKVSVFRGQLLNNQILRVICVLILIDKNIGESRPQFLKNLRKITKQDIRINKNIIKIHCSGLLTFLVIKSIYIPYPGLLCSRIVLRKRRIAQISSRSNQVILSHRDPGEHLIGLIYLLIERELLDTSPYCTPGIRCVINSETLGKPQQFSIFPEEFHKNRVESTHP